MWPTCAEFVMKISIGKCSLCDFIFQAKQTFEPRCFHIHEASSNASLGITISLSGLLSPINMSSYQYRKSHYGDKTVVRSSYLRNGISYTGKTTSLYWIRALMSSDAENLVYLEREYHGGKYCPFRVFFVHEELYQLPGQSQFWETIENENSSYIS